MPPPDLPCSGYDWLLRAYASGSFPMANSRSAAEVYWVNPDMRGVLPLDEFHLPRRLRRVALSDRYTVTTDRAFAATIAACARPRPAADETWINAGIEQVFVGLHLEGHAHSVECWLGDELVGGLYGLALHGVFFGESMFSTATDASKVALVHLVARLRLSGFKLLDTQFVTAHLTQFGAHEIPRAAYLRRLRAALATPARWPDPDLPAEAVAEEIRRMAPKGGEHGGQQGGSKAGAAGGR